MLSPLLYSAAVILTVVSWLCDRERTRQALRSSGKSLATLTPRILEMVLVIGLLLAAVAPETLTSIFRLHGLSGIAVSALVGAVITIPAPIAFPLVGSLLKLGAAPAALATFVTTLTMVGFVSAPVEASYFGRRFTLVRQTVSFVLAVTVGLLMGWLL